MFVFDVEGTKGHLVNPTLRFPDEQEQDGPEGCLSIPGLYFDTKRRINVVAKGYTAHGDPLQIVGDGNLARCLQHETDHLDGVLFIDRMDAGRRRVAMREILAADWNAKVKVSPAQRRNLAAPLRPTVAIGRPDTPCRRARGQPAM